jgi:hypothetical protein
VNGGAPTRLQAACLVAAVGELGSVSHYANHIHQDSLPVVASITVIVVLVAKWNFDAFMADTRAVHGYHGYHGYHGISNGRVSHEGRS